MYYRKRQEKNIGTLRELSIRYFFYLIILARAELVVDDMMRSGLQLDARTLNALVAVYAEAVRVHDVGKTLSRFEENEISFDCYTYRHLIRMHVRARNIDRAMELKAQSDKQGLRLEGVTYGLLIESLTHRDMLVDALKLLEEATEKKIKIPERHVKVLRARCKTLRVVHPDMPADPTQWAKDVRATRKNLRHTSDSRVEHIRTAISFSKS